MNSGQSNCTQIFQSQKRLNICKSWTNHITKRCKGQAGSAVFRNSALQSCSQMNQSPVLQIPLAPELKRYIARHVTLTIFCFVLFGVIYTVLHKVLGRANHCPMLFGIALLDFERNILLLASIVLQLVYPVFQRTMSQTGTCTQLRVG